MGVRTIRWSTNFIIYRVAGYGITGGKMSSVNAISLRRWTVILIWLFMVIPFLQTFIIWGRFIKTGELELSTRIAFILLVIALPVILKVNIWANELRNIHFLLPFSTLMGMLVMFLCNLPRLFATNPYYSMSEVLSNFYNLIFIPYVMFIAGATGFMDFVKGISKPAGRVVWIVLSFSVLIFWHAVVMRFGIIERVGGRFTVLALSDSLTLIFLIMGITVPDQFKLPMLLVGALCLFMVGSRGAFLAYGLGVALYAIIIIFRNLSSVIYERGGKIELMHLKCMFTRLACTVMLTVAIVCITYIAVEYLLRESFMPFVVSKMKAITFPTGVRDPSLRLRLIQLLAGYEIIEAYPITGKLLYEVETCGYGTYMHNILSYWAEYGVSVFVGLILSILFAISYLGVKTARKMFWNDFEVAVLVTLVVFGVEVMFVRSYVSPWIWLMLGASYNVLRCDYTI